MSKGGKKKRSTAGLILDVILTLCTGGLWSKTHFYSPITIYF